MCGIIGTVGRKIDKKIFNIARDVLIHRGPDDAGSFFDEKNCVFLGQRRLSIIDLSSAGHQPFKSNDGRFVLVFNGEIYNYLEIKKELENFYDFQTETDTEVLLASYMKWGEKCLGRFNGMFAFSIWDRREERLFFARDRLGIKPLYYINKGDGFFFASEIKALFAFGHEKKINEKAVYDYLAYAYYDHNEETFFKNIKQLKVGHYAIWQRGKMQIIKYWDLADIKINKSYYQDEEVVITRFKKLLTDSIKLRFRSDVPVGLCLSSGLDSNSLLYYSKQVTGEDVDTISMCSPSKEFNECILVESLLNSQQKRRWHKTFLSHDKIKELSREMSLIQDQPFGGIPTLGFGEIMKEAKKQDITVLLHGQGVDELLAGYKYYENEFLVDQGIISSEKKMKNYFLSQDMSKEVDEKILNQKFYNKYHKKAFDFEKPFKSALLNAQYRDIVYTKIPRTLRFTDQASMAFGRELRVPFLDHRIVEFCFFLPTKYKIRNGEQKWLIRRAMKDVLPPTIMERPKKSFGLVQVELLRKYYKDWVFSVLQDDFFQESFWDYRKLMDKVELFYEGKVNNSFFIWQCLNLNLLLNK